MFAASSDSLTNNFSLVLVRDARAYIEAQRKHDMDEEELERRRSGKSAEKGAQLCKTTGAQPLVSVRYDYDVVSVAHRDRSVRR